ncbi:uncharacterized protein LOC108597174 isoform X2 [Drosophila busckii]|uniref:uncharacterized protein LOC108597174 isoform X2 n=1 Tax=Drosophila busckii TaxID=30019 RepID=UPI00083EF99A|nr:uncharacterized protein LOC108597174 isoform X2 [Drosophila busckii]
MAPALLNATTTTAAAAATTATTLVNIFSTTTVAPAVTYSWTGQNNVTIWDNEPGYVYFYSSYVCYVVLVFLFIILLPLALIASSMQRKRRDAERRLAAQRLQARRQMELSVTSNATHMDNSSVANTEANNDMSILPKGMDLPPSYDELSLKPVGASTLTITTNLSASNPALNEPPPEYELTTSTTTTTTVVINNNSNQ